MIESERRGVLAFVGLILFAMAFAGPPLFVGQQKDALMWKDYGPELKGEDVARAISDMIVRLDALAGEVRLLRWRDSVFFAVGMYLLIPQIVLPLGRKKATRARNPVVPSENDDHA